VKYRDERARLVARRGVVVTVRDGQHLDRRVKAPDELDGPVAKGERVGSVTVLVDGRRVRRVALVTAEKVPGAGTLRVLLSDVGVPLTLLILLAILVAVVFAMLRLRIRIRIAK
jgi:serine-type D-Ala-D-Ala carboxypeptidase (penicillin-binding protein 5/6)